MSISTRDALSNENKFLKNSHTIVKCDPKQKKWCETYDVHCIPRRQINGKTLFLSVEGESLRKKRVKTGLPDETKKSTSVNTCFCIINGFTSNKIRNILLHIP